MSCVRVSVSGVLFSVGVCACVWPVVLFTVPLFTPCKSHQGQLLLVRSAGLSIHSSPIHTLQERSRLVTKANFFSFVPPDSFTAPLFTPCRSARASSPRPTSSPSFRPRNGRGWSMCLCRGTLQRLHISNLYSQLLFTPCRSARASLPRPTSSPSLRLRNGRGWSMCLCRGTLQRLHISNLYSQLLFTPCRSARASLPRPTSSPSFRLRNGPGWSMCLCRGTRQPSVPRRCCRRVPTKMGPACFIEAVPSHKLCR